MNLFVIAATLVAAVGSLTLGVTYSQSEGSTQYQVSIDATAHQTFGLYYPVTYMFRYSPGSGGLVAQYRTNASAAWTALPEKTPSDLFDGINAARFDAVNGIAYLSVAFAQSSNDLFLRVLDGQNQEIPLSYLGIPTYYDNRKAAVTLSLDDWDAASGPDFNTAATILSRRNLHFTVGVITGHSPDWSLIQQWVNTGWMEVASHSRTHPCVESDYTSTGYANEIAGSKQDILAHLTLPHPYLLTYLEPCGLETAGLRQAVVNAGYLDTRGYPVPPVGNTFAAWGTDGSYQRALYSIDTWTWPWNTQDNTRLAQANAAFDAAYAAGGIYHLVDHPWQERWFLGGTLDSHSQYIANRSDVWYASFGELYLYHYVQERGQTTVNPVGQPATVVAPDPTGTPVPTAPPAPSYSLWSDDVLPAVASIADPQSVEVGVKFLSATSGSITGLRFYKGAANTGPHVGHLWTSTGSLLAQVTFTNETATGWQVATFDTPVAIAANTLYVASYHTDSGNFALSQQYFMAGYYNAPLYAPANSEVAGGNGVFRYGASAFPDQSYEYSNYWVDVVFSPTPTATATPTPAATSTPVPPTPTSVPVTSTGASLWNVAATPAVASVGDPNPVELGIKFRASADGFITGLRFYKGAANTGTHTGHLWSGAGALLGSLTFTGETASGWQTASFDAPVAVTAGTTYVASYHTDTGNYALTRPYFTTGYTRGLLYAFASSEVAGGNGVYRYGASAFPDQTYDAGNYWVDVIYDAATGELPTATPTPEVTATSLPPTATPTQTPTPTVVTGASLWNAAPTPAVISIGDPSPVELGVKFRTSVDGAITGLRFYKSSANTGTHTGHLWSGAGVLLANLTFTGETASGWQTAGFDTPVAVTAGTTYVASYHTNAGNFSLTRPYFTTGYTSGSLYAFASNEVAGGNGVYRYGASAFPDQTYDASNYWVDVIFSR